MQIRMSDGMPGKKRGFEPDRLPGLIIRLHSIISVIPVEFARAIYFSRPTYSMGPDRWESFLVKPASDSYVLPLNFQH